MKDLENVGDDGLFIDTVGPWSEEKYRLVSLYATMFTKAMRDKFDALVYVDMFAGPGRVQVKATPRIYASSPMNAQAIEPRFDRLIFCEHDEARMAALKARCATHGADRDVRFVSGDVNAKVGEILQHIPKYRKDYGVLTLCFVDPYKMANLRFKTLEAFRALWVDFLVLIPSEMDAERGKQAYIDTDNATVGTFVGNPDWRSVWSNVEKNGIRFEYRLALYSRSKIAGKFWAQAQKYATPNRDLFS